MATPWPTINHESFDWEYAVVFLSFKHEDRCNTFTSELNNALRYAGISTYITKEELRNGESLAPELTRAIRKSRISMIFFSKDYPWSTGCLEELVEILECKEKGKQIVFPIFLDIEPSEVRKQSGNYGMAFAKHEERFQGSDKVQKWRDALTKIADMSGWDLQGMVNNGYEYKFINSILKEVQLILTRVPMFVVKHPVGLDSRVENVVQLLQGKSNDGVGMIGIYGMRGIGKSVLARAVYNILFLRFNRSCFLEINSEIKQDDELIKRLQKQLFLKLLNKEIDVGSIDEGILLMQNQLRGKECLIVLDNMEHISQFKALCGERDWFGEGSILILTTAHKHVLQYLKEDECYEAKELNAEESLQLFKLHAFREPVLPKNGYTELLDSVMAYCGGVPIALEVIGAVLYGGSKEEWMSTLKKLEAISQADIHAILKLSFDRVPDDSTKSLFLDLVCFSDNISMETIDSMGHDSTIEIRNLVDNCLIKRQHSWISMHNLIRMMGREIIRRESFRNPGKRSRLWYPCDIHDVLVGNKGTNKIEMIIFNGSPVENMKYNTKAFKNMTNLRFLLIDGVHVDGKFEHLPKKLRYLEWNDCPLKNINIPSDCSFKNVELEIEESNVEEFQAHSKPGRPRKLRKKFTGELNKDGVHLSKKFVNLHCCICKSQGHNRRKCPQRIVNEGQWWQKMV